MTTADLIGYLNQFDSDTHVFLTNDQAFEARPMDLELESDFQYITLDCLDFQPTTG